MKASIISIFRSECSPENEKIIISFTAKIMKKIMLFIFGILSLQAFAQKEINFYLVLAAENNPGLKAKFNDYLSAMEQIPQTTGLPDPQLTFGLFVQPVETRVGPQRATLAVNQSFPWFGTLKAKGDVAAKYADAKLIAFEDAKIKLYRDIRIKYNQLYFIQQSIELTTENLGLLASFKELARVNFESGKTGFVNVLRVEMEEEELKAQLEFLNDSKASSFAEFENLLNTSLTEEVSFPNSLAIVQLSQSKQSLYDSIIENNLELKELQLLMEGKEQQVKAAELMGKPSFMLGASYINIGERTDVDIPDNGQDAFLFPQVGLKIPLFQKKYKAMQKQASIQKEGFQHKIEDKNNQLSSNLENLIKDHLDAQRRLNLYEKLHDLAERSLALLQTEFTTGTTDFEEVLRMERKLLTYQLAMQKASVDNNNAIYKINYLSGK
ncbi:MAG: TolC family protein [bacterium]|nr:TolC family protein [bacterium]